MNYHVMSWSVLVVVIVNSLSKLNFGKFCLKFTSGLVSQRNPFRLWCYGVTKIHINNGVYEEHRWFFFFFKFFIFFENFAFWENLKHLIPPKKQNFIYPRVCHIMAQPLSLQSFSKCSTCAFVSYTLIHATKCIQHWTHFEGVELLH